MKLNNVLTEEQTAAGLTLHDDEDFIRLFYAGKVLATWSTQGVNPVMIRVKAQELLDRLISLGEVAESEKSKTPN